MRRRHLGLLVGTGLGFIALLAAGLAATATASHHQVRPQITVIEANFVPLDRATYYDVKLNDPVAASSDWTWTLTPPTDDPTCNKFEVLEQQRDQSRAVWRHGEDDGCKHNSTEHAGRVDVSVVHGDYTCNATITGTSSHFGPSPEPCFKKAAPPTTTTTTTTPKGTTPPAQDKPQKEKDKLNKADAALEGVGALLMGVGAAFGAYGTVQAAFGAGATATGVGAPVGVPAIITGAVIAFVGAGLTALGKYYAYAAVDPPSNQYAVVATPRSITLPHVKAPAGSTAQTKKAAAALNAEIDNVARLVSVLQALRTSVDRATGAIKAGAKAEAARQRQAVVRFARQAASLMEKNVALRHAAAAALDAAHVRLTITKTGMARAYQRAFEKGIPAQATEVLRRLGLDRATIRALQRQAVESLRRVRTVSFPGVLRDPGMATAERAAARAVREWAAVVAAH